MVKETKIEVSCVFDGGPDAVDVFISLIADKYRREKEVTAKPEDVCYNVGMVQNSRCPSGECA